MSESPSLEASGHPDLLIISTGQSDRGARYSMNGPTASIIVPNFDPDSCCVAAADKCTLMARTTQCGQKYCVST